MSKALHPYDLAGRDTEYQALLDHVADPTCRAVVVIGNQGTGKSRLLWELKENAGQDLAKRTPSRECHPYYEELIQTPGDTAFLSRITLSLHEVAGRKFRPLSQVIGATEGFTGLLATFGLAINKGTSLGIGSIVGHIQNWLAKSPKPPLETFILCLQFWDHVVPPSQRMVVIIDSDEKAFHALETLWERVVQSTPQRFCFVLAARPESPLLSTLRPLPQVRQISLSPALDEKSVEQIVEQALREGKREYPPVIRDRDTLLAKIRLYQGYPLEIVSALGLVFKARQSVESLPQDPKGLWDKVWQQICQDTDAQKLAVAYQTLTTAVPDHLAQATAGLEGPNFRRALSDRFFESLFPQNDQGWRRPFHGRLTEKISSEIPAQEQKECYTHAAEALKSWKTRSDWPLPEQELYALEFPRQAEAAWGKKRAILAFVNEATPLLHRFGLLDQIITQSERWLANEQDPETKAAVTSNLGNVYRTRGELGKAEETYEKALAIHQELGNKEGMANDYGNLGSVYQTRGELGKAQEAYEKALKIHQELGRKEGIANNYTGLGIVHQTRGELHKAKQSFTQALALFTELGAKPKIELIQDLLAALPPNTSPP